MLSHNIFFQCPAALLLDSSVGRVPDVNQAVAGSNPARGAIIGVWSSGLRHQIYPHICQKILQGYSLIG